MPLWEGTGLGMRDTRTVESEAPVLAGQGPDPPLRSGSDSARHTDTHTHTAASAAAPRPGRVLGGRPE